MVEKGISSGKFHAVYQYTAANKKYMRNQNKNKQSLFLIFPDANNIQSWEMSEKLPVDNFK